MAEDNKTTKHIEKIDLREKEEAIERAKHGAEQIKQPEREIVLEAVKEQAEEAVETPPVEQEGKTGEAISAAPTPQGARHSEREKKIETILADGLVDAYSNMPESKRLEFKQVGEATSRQINELIEKGKHTAAKIVSLIKKWLALIPGVNKYFLEQEAKLKTDRILKDCQENKPDTS